LSCRALPRGGAGLRPLRPLRQAACTPHLQQVGVLLVHQLVKAEPLGCAGAAGAFEGASQRQHAREGRGGLTGGSPRGPPPHEQPCTPTRSTLPWAQLRLCTSSVGRMLTYSSHLCRVRPLLQLPGRHRAATPVSGVDGSASHTRVFHSPPDAPWLFSHPNGVRPCASRPHIGFRAWWGLAACRRQLYACLGLPEPCTTSPAFG